MIYPYLTIKERDDTYWRQRNKEYVAHLGPQKVEERAKTLVPIWELYLKDQYAPVARYSIPAIGYAKRPGCRAWKPARCARATWSARSTAMW